MQKPKFNPKYLHDLSEEEAFEAYYHIAVWKPDREKIDKLLGIQSKDK